MRLTVVLLTLAFVQVHGRGVAQKVTLSGNELTLKEVFSEIKRQTGFVLFYKKTFVDEAEKVNVRASEMPLENFLQVVLKDRPIDFTIQGKTIILSPKPGKGKSLRDDIQAVPLADSVTVVVTDSAGNALPGAYITVRNKPVSAIADASGRATIAAQRGDVIVVSFVGLQTQEVRIVSGVSGIRVKLEPVMTELETVAITVNTGFQSLNRERATGSFGTVDREQLEKPSTNIGQRLIGQISGMQARLDVNGNPTFEIRGLTSLNTTVASPLIVLDGFPIEGDFNSINPNIVESVTVLKDAAAASIWGARSANGVIVVTTKNAKRGVPLKVEASAFTRTGAKFVLDYVNPLASSAETVEYEKRAYPGWYIISNSGTIADVTTSVSKASQAMLEHGLGWITLEERDAILENLKNISNKKQIKDYLLASPVTNQVNLNLLGSTGRMTNSLSLLYETNQSNFKETNDKRYMINYKSVANITRFLDLTAGAMIQYVDAKNSGVTLTDIQNYSPYDMLINSDGSYGDMEPYYTPSLKRYVPMERFPYADWTSNPLVDIHNRDIRSKQLNARVQGGVSFKLLPGLSFESKGQYELFNTLNRNLYNENTYYVRNLINTSSTWINRNDPTSQIIPNLPKGSILLQSRSKRESYTVRTQVNFNRNFGRDHELNAVAGTELIRTQAETITNPTAYGYNDKTLVVSPFPNGPGNTPSTTPAGATSIRLPNWLGGTTGAGQTFSYINTISGYRIEKFFSYFGNAAYTFRKTYTLSGSIRNDASNMISEDPKYRYAPFWSVGGAWQVSQEDFFQSKFIDRLGVRLTYGYNGNVDRTTSFIPLISMTGVDPFSNFTTAQISSYGNPTLRWERTGTWNLGVDYAMFNNKLFGSVNLYNKKSIDLLADIAVTSTYGPTSVKINNAEMSNRGVELEVGTLLPIKSPKITWQGNLNFSYNKNRIDKLFIINHVAPLMSRGGTYAYVEGGNANDIWTYEYAGIENNQPTFYGPVDENGNKSRYMFAAYPPGDAKAFMVNKGTSVAPYTLGFSNSFRVHDFNLSFILTGKFGHKFRRKSFNYIYPGIGKTLPNSRLSEAMNADPEKMIPLPLNEIEPNYISWINFANYMDYLIVSANHVRMQEAMLTWNLKQRWLSRIDVSRAQVFVQGNDLFTWYSNKWKEDPEYPMGTMNPRPKFTFGFRIEL